MSFQHVSSQHVSLICVISTCVISTCVINMCHLKLKHWSSTLHPIAVTIITHSYHFITVNLTCTSLSHLRAFKERMNKLLRKLLKLDPQERMTCEEFVAFADDLMKIRLVNVLHGTTLEVTLDFNMVYVHTHLCTYCTHMLLQCCCRPDHLVVEISKKMKISPQFLVFFTGAHLFCTTHHLITEEEFHTMLKHSNEKEVGLIYLVGSICPFVTQLSFTGSPNTVCVGFKAASGTGEAPGFWTVQAAL